MSETLNLDTIGVAELAALYEAKGTGLTLSLLKQTKAPLGSLKTAPLVFQPRDMTDRRWVKQRHIEALTKALKESGKLDHIDVFAVDGVRIVVDGHCRLEAYRKAGFKENRRVPVRHVQGSFADALKTSATANSKDKLALTSNEKAEAAWRMVIFSERRECYSLRAIAGATAASKSNVNNMRKVLKRALDFDPRQCSWREVKRRLRNEVEYSEDWKEKQMRAFAEKLWKHFGRKPSVQPELFLDAIEYAYPQVLSEMLERLAHQRRDELVDLASTYDDDDDSDF